MKNSDIKVEGTIIICAKVVKCKLVGENLAWSLDPNDLVWFVLNDTKSSMLKLLLIKNMMSASSYTKFLIRRIFIKDKFTM